MTITGTFQGGATISSNPAGLTTATTLNLDWTGLVSVSFEASDDAGIDDIVVQSDIPPIPALSPWSSILMALLLASFGVAARRRV